MIEFAEVECKTVLEVGPYDVVGTYRDSRRDVNYLVLGRLFEEGFRFAYDNYETDEIMYLSKQEIPQEIAQEMSRGKLEEAGYTVLDAKAYCEAGDILEILRG